MQFYPSPVEEDVIRMLLEAEEQLIIDEDFIIEEDEEQGNHTLSKCNLPPFIQPLLHVYCYSITHAPLLNMVWELRTKRKASQAQTVLY